ncbi:STAS domain-containing protein [Streptomyces collinus]|uniref:STAS domain-containing protein n=1 Tax=Streptomyces collinus TaxID=42684 RepID=UPI003800318C
MTDAFHIDVPHTDGALAVIALSGEFDIAAAPAARALELIANGRPDLVADLSGVTFCDSSGLGALVGIWRCAKEADDSPSTVKRGRPARKRPPITLSDAPAAG